MPDLSPNSGFSVHPTEPAQRLRALVLCGKCTERRVVEIHRGELVVLQRDGTLNLDCPACHAHSRDALIRFGR